MRPKHIFGNIGVWQRKTCSEKKSHDSLKVVERDACSRFRNGNQGGGGTHHMLESRPGIGWCLLDVVFLTEDLGHWIWDLEI